MKVIGLSGASGSGKSTFAGLAAGILSGLGHSVLVDSFAAPIKWLCYARGWDGVMTPEWRREMQDLGIEARRMERWSGRYIRFARRLEERAGITHADMMHLEAIAREWRLDKFVCWLACRHGLTKEHALGGWSEMYFGSYFTHPDFLIIPDVRFPAEAAFCKELGVLLFLDGSHEPLGDGLAEHVSESHLPAIRRDADAIITPATNTQPDVALVRRVILDLLSPGPKGTSCQTK